MLDIKKNTQTKKKPNTTPRDLSYLVLQLYNLFGV